MKTSSVFRILLCCLLFGSVLPVRSELYFVFGLLLPPDERGMNYPDPYLHTVIDHPDPSVFHPGVLRLIESGVTLSDYHIDKDKARPHKLFVRGYSDGIYFLATISFRPDQVQSSADVGQFQFTATFLDEEQKPTLGKASFVKVSSEKLGRFLFSADLEGPDHFGTLIEHRLPNGTVFTREELKVERILDEKGWLRQGHSPSVTYDLLDLGEEGMDLHVYRTSDLPQEKTQEGLYQIPEEATPLSSWLIRYPRPGDHSVFRSIRIHEARITSVRDGFLYDAEKGRFYIHDYAEAEFPELVPEAWVPQLQKTVAKDAWLEPDDSGEEVGERYRKQHGRFYVSDLVDRTQADSESVKYAMTLADVDPETTGVLLERLRVMDPGFQDWKAVEYDDQRRLKAEFRPLNPSSGTPPPPDLNAEKLRAVSDWIELEYATEESNRISVLTHWRGETFVSRNWLRYGQDEFGLLIEVERSSDPEAKRGNPGNVREKLLSGAVPADLLDAFSSPSP